MVALDNDFEALLNIESRLSRFIKTLEGDEHESIFSSDPAQNIEYFKERERENF